MQGFADRILPGETTDEALETRICRSGGEAGAAETMSPRLVMASRERCLFILL